MYRFKYSTPSAFFADVEKKSKCNHDYRKNDASVDSTFASQPSEIIPRVTGDFLPYSDNHFNDWTGFYGSRPRLKTLVRTFEGELRFVESLLFLHLIKYYATSITRDRLLNHKVRNLSLVEVISGLREELTLAQHHDSITGTSTARVSHYLETRMFSARSKLREVLVHILIHKQDSSADRIANPETPNFLRSENVADVARKSRLRFQAGHRNEMDIPAQPTSGSYPGFDFMLASFFQEIPLRVQLNPTLDDEDDPLKYYENYPGNHSKGTIFERTDSDAVILVHLDYSSVILQSLIDGFLSPFGFSENAFYELGFPQPVSSYRD